MRFIEEFYNTPDVEQKRLRDDAALVNQLLPYRSYDQQHAIFLNQHSLAFLLEVSPLLGCDESSINVLTNMICDGFPDGATVQFLNLASMNISEQLEHWQKVRGGVKPIYQTLADKRVDFLGTTNLKQKFRTPFVSRNFRLFASVSLSLGSSTYDQQIKNLASIRNNFISTLKSIGAYVREMDPEDLLNLVDEIINIGIERDFKRKRYNEFDPINTQISRPETHLAVSDKQLEFNQQFFAKVLTPIQYPREWGQFQNADLLGDFFSFHKQIPCPFLTSFSFHIEEQARAKEKAATKLTTSMHAAKSPLAALVPSMRQKAIDYKFLNDKLTEGQKVVKTMHHLVLFAESSEQLDDCERKAKSLYQSKEFSLGTEKHAQLLNFRACLPMLPGDGVIKDFIRKGKARTLASFNCSNLMPLQGDFKGNDPKFQTMPFFSRRGQLFFWNPFENEEGNYNTAVVGKSGSGKSFFMQELVANLRGAGGKVYIIDDGHSFEKSVMLQGGQFIEFGSNKRICLNPFSMVNAENFAADTSYRTDVLVLLTNIVKQMAHQEEKCSDYESGEIAKAVSEAWQQKGNAASITTVCSILSGNNDKRTNDIAKMLFPFTKDGLYGTFFEGQATIKIADDLMAFELSEIKSRKELQRIVMMVLMFLVSESMYKGDRKRSTSLVIDEAWDLLSGSAMSEFIEGMARRARKYKGNLITGTQSINDYYKNPAAEAAIQNTDWTIYLAQKPDALDQANKSGRINFNEYQMQVLKSITKTDDFSECCITGPGIFAVGRVIIDPFSIILFSSKAEHYARVQELHNSGLSLEDAIAKAAEYFFGGRA